MNIYTGILRITPEIVAKAKAVQYHAFLHRETLKDLRNRISTHTAAPGLRPEHCLDIPVGYHVVYSIEQNEPGWCHHVAINVTQPKMDPSPGAVVSILGLFGIKQATASKKGILGDAIQIWGEDINRVTSARNLLYPFDFVAMQKQFEAQAQVAAESR